MTVLEQTKNLAALTDIIQAINSSLELNEVLRMVMDTIIKLTNAERGFLMLKNEQGELNTVIARNWEQETINHSESAVSRTLIQRVLTEGQPILTTNAQEDPRFEAQVSVIIHNLRSILCVPLKVKDVLTGVIYTDNRVRSGIFTEHEKELLTTFANHAAVALENARLFASVTQTLAKVTELKNLMDNVFTSVASGVMTTDPEQRITLCNQAAQKIFGRTEQDLVGRHLGDIFTHLLHPGLTRDFLHEVDVVRKTGKSVVGKELVFSRPQRGPMIVSINLSPLIDASHATQGVAMIIDDLTEKKRLLAQRGLFERMVSPGLIKQINPERLQLGGSCTEVSILFADIRGFTTFSERSSPEKLVHTLNLYLAAAADSILAQEGTIDKFQGDAVMAWFNAPVPQADHTLKAVRAALGIRDAVQTLKGKLAPEDHLSYSAGIHFGEAVLGLIGTKKRMDYTAVGDSVNTAKRIQENAAPEQILISQAAYALVAREIEAREVTPIVAKGKKEPLLVYEILGMKS